MSQQQASTTKIETHAEFTGFLKSQPQLKGLSADDFAVVSVNAVNEESMKAMGDRIQARQAARVADTIAPSTPTKRPGLN